MTLSSYNKKPFLLSFLFIIDAACLNCNFQYAEALSIPSPVRSMHQTRSQLHISSPFHISETKRRTGLSTTHTACENESSYFRTTSHLRASITSQSEDIPLESSIKSSSDVNTSVEKTTAPLGSYKSIITFVSTTVIIWLSEPILSLVDTTVLGRFATTSSSAVIQLAALGPATMLIDSAIYLTYFLAIATTNQLAKAIAEKDKRAQQRTTSHALGVAAFLGISITTVVLSFGIPILKWIIGDGGGSASAAKDSAIMLNEALQYARIRCLVAPLSVMGIIAQSAALASLDTWTPLLAVMIASFTNIVGDMALCVHPFQMGIKGAAIATAAASAIGSMTLLFSTKKRMKRLSAMDSTQNIVESSKEAPIPFLSLPDKKSMWNLFKLAGPIFFVITGKLICYSAMTVRATSFGVLSLACHNVMLRIFFFFTTFGDSLSQSAQTMLPQVLYSQDKDEIDYNTNEDILKFNKNTMDFDSTSIADETIQSQPKNSVFSKLKQTITFPRSNKKNKTTPSPFLSIFYRHFVLCIVTGIASQLISSNILTTKSALFTSDNAMSQMMSKYAPWISVSLLVHPIIMLFEGSLVASRDLGYLVGCYGLTICTLLFQLNRYCDTFTGIWKSLFLLQFSRLLFFGLRVSRKMIFKNKTEEVNAK